MGNASHLDKLVVVGQFSGPHGVRGQFKIRSFTADPKSVGNYGPLQTKSGRTLTFNLLREVKPSLFVAESPDIQSPEQCDAFKGELLHADRSHLPPTDDDDEFYFSDLVGLNAKTPDGGDAGQVKAVVNYGAGDILELENVPGRKGGALIPFTKADVPAIDIKLGLVTVVLAEDDQSPPVGDGAPSA